LGVYCQLVYLRGCHPGRIRLTELPETLDETYERTLREINKADWELAHRLLQCVAVASRPLRVEELAEFLAFDFKAGPIATFHEGWRLDDPLDAVLSACSTLLALVSVDGSAVIQFSHFSVREFLTSTRLAEADVTILRRYHLSMTSAHTIVAQACLGILLHLDKTITRNNLEGYHLAEYAARHWFEHARFGNVAQCVEDGMKQLFDPRKPHLAIWVWICDPRHPSMNSERAERPSQPGGAPLHYAAVCGLHEIVKFLAVEHSPDLHSRAFDNEFTTLHVASIYGHLEVARILVEYGVDVTARTNLGWTPLHSRRVMAT
jgi:Ankyrin repeats (3 copies)